MKVHLVVTGSEFRKNVEAVFSKAELAKTVAKEFPTGRVLEFEIFDDIPNLYRYEVWMEKDTGDVVESNISTPSFYPVFSETGEGLIYALGLSEEDAYERAEQFRQDLMNDPL